MFTHAEAKQHALACHHPRHQVAMCIPESSHHGMQNRVSVARPPKPLAPSAIQGTRLQKGAAQHSSVLNPSREGLHAAPQTKYCRPLHRLALASRMVWQNTRKTPSACSQASPANTPNLHKISRSHYHILADSINSATPAVCMHMPLAVHAGCQLQPRLMPRKHTSVVNSPSPDIYLPLDRSPLAQQPAPCLRSTPHTLHSASTLPRRTSGRGAPGRDQVP